MRFSGLAAWRLTAVALLAAAIAVAGCGSSKKSASTASTQTTTTTTPTTLALSVSETGKTAKFTGPSTAPGGLVTVQLTNNGKALHGAQLIRIVGAHTIEEAVKTIGGESTKTPEWLRAEGGVGGAPPGQAGSATLNLPAGNYAVVDFAGAREGGGGRPAIAPLTVTAGQPGSVPTAPTVITAANPSKDKYAWEISGPLRAGGNAVTFVSKGKSALHEISAIRITREEPTATIVKAFESNGPPPSWVDPNSGTATAVIDGGKSLNTQLVLLKPGKYVLVCHLTDRDGGKPHFAEGLIKTVTIQ